MYDYRLFFPNTRFDDRRRQPRRPILGHGSEERVHRPQSGRRDIREQGRR
jgi:hypothetical protein